MINSFYMLAFLIGCLVGTVLVFAVLLFLSVFGGGDE
jgi:hypothetical protein